MTREVDAMKAGTRVLLVEDDVNDAELVARALDEPGSTPFVTQRVDRLDALESCLTTSPPDLVLADFALAGFTAFDILSTVKAHAPRVPVIVVTGSIDEETAVRCIHEGAADYLLKTSLHRLRHAAEAAIDRARLREENERQTNELVAAAERQLAQLALLGAVLESSADPIFSVDRDGRYTSLNGAHAATMKKAYDADVAPGRRLVDFVGVPEHRAAAERNFSRALAGERFVESFVLGDRDFEVWYYPIIDGSGASTGVAVMARDVTERRRSDEMMLRAQKHESLGVLAGGVAHDFNNLLTVIMGNHSLALLEIDRASKAAGHIENATRAAERAAGLTRQMLAYSGRGRFLSEPIDLSERVRARASLYEAIIGKHIRLDLDLASRLPPLVGDPEQIDQILMNLVTNASEAIGSDAGSITISTRRQDIPEPPGGDPLQESPIGTCVVLEVRDDGPGMSEDTARRALDPFFSTKFTGRGLGLAAVSGIVRAHHGTIDLQTAPGQGTRVRITLPVRVERDAEIPGPATGRPVVLVIDDEADLLALVRAVLTRDGFDVVAESSGADAIATFRRIHDELAAVVLDLSMPDMGGEKVLPELRGVDASVPVILSSGFDVEDVRRRIDVDLVEAFLGKPYRPDTLLEVVRRVVRESRHA